MREYIDSILREIDSEIDRFAIYGYDIIENSLKMIDLIQSHIDRLREKIIIHQFSSQEEEIAFFKELKPQVLSKQLYFNRIYCIEAKSVHISFPKSIQIIPRQQIDYAVR